MSSFGRKTLNALLPPGAIWSVEDDSTLDDFYDGVASPLDTIQEFLGDLARLRAPALTPDLDTLEEEYGVSVDTTLDEATRVARLAAARTASPGTGAYDHLQSQLQTSGFDLYVYENSPAVDPAGIIDRTASSVFGNTAAVFGNAAAVFGGIGGQLVVNSNVVTHSASYVESEVVYPTPEDEKYWPLVFFVGGDSAIRDTDGSLLNVSAALVKTSRRDELIKLLVKYKPLHSWCGLIVSYT